MPHPSSAWASRRRPSPRPSQSRGPSKADREVAAVDRGDVARLQRQERMRFVPVQQMAAMVLQPVDGVERIGQPHGELAQSDMAELPGRERGQEHHADVGRRGAPRDLLVRRLLVVVGRQPVVLGAHEGLEIEPAAPRDGAQEVAILLAGLLDRDRPCAAGADGDLRSEEPEDEQGRGRQQRTRRHERQSRGGEQGDGRRGPHSAPGGGARVERRQAGGDVRRGRPLQQAAARQPPPQGADDRVGGDDRVVDHEHDRQRPAAGMVAQPAHGAQHHPAPPAPRQPGDQVGEQIGAGRGDGQRGPHPRAAGQQEPAGERQRHQAGRHQAAAEVVGDLPAVQKGQPVREARSVPAGDAGRQPGQELPVTAHPAVPAPRMVEIAGGESFVDDDVAHQRRPSVQPLDEIVAEHAVFGDAALEAAFEGGDLVDALADEDAAAEQVLVDVGNGARIDVDRHVAGEIAGERRARDVLGRDLHARLQDRVAGADPAGPFVEARPVEGVRQGADQPVDRARRQARVGVGRDHEADAAQLLHRPGGKDEGAGVAAEHEGVEVFQLAALALPAHPAAFRGIEAARPVQQPERPRVPAMAGVERIDRPDQRALHRFVAGKPLGPGVGMVAQEHELQGRIGIGQEVPLQAQRQAGRLGRVRDERGHHHGGGILRRNRPGEVELGQSCRLHGQRHDPVDDGDAQHGGRQCGERDAGKPGRGRGPHGRQIERRNDEPGHGRQKQPGAVERAAMAAQPPGQHHGRRQPCPEHRLEGGTSAADQPVADVVERLAAGLRLAVGEQVAGHLPFLLPRLQRHLLDDVAVGVPAVEIHAGVRAGRIAPQAVLNLAGAVEEVLPRDGRDDGQVGQRPRHAFGIVHGGGDGRAGTGGKRRLRLRKQTREARGQHL